MPAPPAQPSPGAARPAASVTGDAASAGPLPVLQEEDASQHAHQQPLRNVTPQHQHDYAIQRERERYSETQHGHHGHAIS